MIRVQGTIPYPPTANSQPIRQFAASLRRLSAGLGQTAGQLTGVGATASGSWTGAAADACGRRLAERSGTTRRASTAIGSAAPVLDTYAAAIDTTSAAYTSAAVAEQAARAGLPWTAGALAAALAAEQAAVAALLAAGSACASALAAINAEVATALFVGIDASSFGSAVEGIMSVWNGVEHLTGSETTGGEPDVRAATEQLDVAMCELDAQIEALAATGTARADAATAPEPRLDQASVASQPDAGRSTTGLYDVAFGEEWGSEVGLGADTVGHLADLWERIEAIQPRAGQVIDPATGEPFAVRANEVVRARSPIVDRFGQPFEHAAGPYGSARGRSLLVDRFGNPIETGRAGPLVDPVTGRPFGADAAGRPVAGDRTITVQRSLPTDAPAPAGSVLQRLERIAGEVAEMDVHLERPVPATATSSGWQTAGRALTIAGRAINVVGAAAGGWDIGRGIREGNGYRIADGAINVGLAIAGALTLATPVGWALLAVGALWSVGSYLSGDVPLTRRIRDAAADVVDSVAASPTRIAVPAP